jgi:hypothetical protein
MLQILKIVVCLTCLMHSHAFPSSGAENWSSLPVRSGESLDEGSIEEEMETYFPELTNENDVLNISVSENFSSNAFVVANNKTSSTVSYKNVFCAKQVELTIKLLNCNPSDICCNLNVYEDRFTYESQICNNKKNISSINKQMCDNLNSCHTSCKQKVSMYDGCRDVTIPKYNNIVYSCYQSCFAKEYKCPEAMLNTNTKKLSVGEIIILVICLTSFGYCIFRYTLCRDCHCDMNQNSRESKVHADTTVENYSNV